MSYFKYFPKIEYNGVQSLNIMARAKILEDSIKKYSVFYKYVINREERPDQVALKYYGSENYTWLVFLSNQIIDPYFSWALTQDELHSYIRKKHKISVEESLSKISHYEYEGLETEVIEGIETTDIENKYFMSETTFNYLKENEPSKVIGWVPVYIYDFEENENEKRRNIFLLGKQYLSKIESDFKKVFS